MMIVRKCNQWLSQYSYLSPFFLRVVVGVIMTAHGCDKLWGCFHGGGLMETAKAFESMGLTPGILHAILGGGGEFVGGMLLLLGLFTRLGALLVAATMVVAIGVVHIQAGLFAMDGGFEYPLALLAASLSLLVSGGGSFMSADETIFGQDK